ncbi:MAG: hypothetical protein PHD54_00650 [Desulfuromonadaceae bacterium]|nr:hypothetical protein [Desulfuromonadaceae bacterium]
MRFARIFILVMIAAMLLTVILSCGKSNTGEFDYVTATATVDAAKNPLLADLATWTGTPCAAGSTYNVLNNVVNFTLTSTANLAIGSSSPLILQKATISLSPADTQSPSLPALYSPIYQGLTGYIIPAGGTLSVPVEIATHSLKDYFTQTLVCTANKSIYSYNVSIVFDAVEQTTGRSGSIPASMTVRFADFGD